MALAAPAAHQKTSHPRRVGPDAAARGGGGPDGAGADLPLDGGDHDLRRRLHAGPLRPGRHAPLPELRAAGAADPYYFFE